MSESSTPRFCIASVSAWSKSPTAEMAGERRGEHLVALECRPHKVPRARRVREAVQADDHSERTSAPVAANGTRNTCAQPSASS
jgi:hypothetical protein